MPDGIYDCTAAEVFRCFVAQFPDSVTRLRIWTGFPKLLSRLNEFGISSTLWIDGSFVTQKSDPNDVDVVAFIKSEDLNSLHSDAIVFLKSLLKARTSQAEFSTHFFIVPIYDKTDLQYATFEQARMYWRKWWGRTRFGNAKGFVQMTVGSASGRSGGSSQE